MNRIFGKKRKGLQEQDIEKNTDALSAVCVKHPDQSLNLFCFECDNMYCTLCMITGVHKKVYEFHDIRCITEVAEEFKKSTEFKSFDENMSKFRNDLERTLDSINENMNESEQLKCEVENKIKHQKETLIELIETQYQKISEINSNKHAECLSRLTSTAAQIAKLKEETEIIENDTSKKRNKSDMTTVFIAMKKSQRKIAQIEDKVRMLNKNNYITRYDFQAGQNTQSFMKKTEDFGIFVEDRKRKASTPPKRPLQRYKSLPTLSREVEYEITYDEVEYTDIEYLEPETTVSTNGETIQGDILKCEEPIKTSSASSGTKPKPKPRLKTPSPNMSDEETKQIMLSRQLSLQISAMNLDGQSGAPVPNRKPPVQPKHHEKETSTTSFDKPVQQRQGFLVAGPKPSAKPRKQTKDNIASSFDEAMQQGKGPPAKDTRPSVKPRKDVKEKNVPCSDAQVQEQHDKYKVLYQYTSTGEHGMTISEEDIVTVIETFDDGWCWIEKNRQCGYVPRNYLEKVMK